MGRAWFTEYEHVSTDFDNLNIVCPKITCASFVEKVVTAGSPAQGATPSQPTIAATDPAIAFNEITEGIFGRKVYIIVDTEDMQGDDITIELVRHDDGTNAVKSITDGTADVASFTATVGDTTALEDINSTNPYGNLTDFEDKAIFKIEVRPHARADFDIWAQEINNATSPSLKVRVKPADAQLIVEYNDTGVDNSQTHPDGFIFGQYDVENKNVYEIYHGDNVFNPLGNHTVNNNQIRRRLGKIESFYTNPQNQRIDLTDDFTFFYHNSIDNEVIVDTLIKNNDGLIQFPANGSGFGRYGTVDAGGNDTPIPENVGAGDHYLMPTTVAALFGVTQEVNSKNWNVDFGDMSSENGSDPWEIQYVTTNNANSSRGHHAGHGHLSNRTGLDVDMRYLDNNGNSFHGEITNVVFNDANNVTLFQIAFDYGFHLNYATTKAHYAGVNATVTNHTNHGHWGLDVNAETII